MKQLTSATAIVKIHLLIDNSKIYLNHIDIRHIKTRNISCETARVSNYALEIFIKINFNELFDKYNIYEIQKVALLLDCSFVKEQIPENSLANYQMLVIPIIV